MTQQIKIVLDVAIPDEVDPESAGGWVFNHLCEYADEDLIYSVDGYDIERKP